MKLVDPSGNVAEVLRLGLVEGVSVRQIARQLSMARKTVRKILGRHHPPAKLTAPRGSLLDPYEKAIHTLLDDTPEMLTPAVLERLRPLGYTGAGPIPHTLLPGPRPHRPRDAFPTLHLRSAVALTADIGHLRLPPPAAAPPL